MRVITTDIAKAIKTIMLAGFSLRLVPYNMIDAMMSIRQSEINVPMMKVDKCSNTVVSKKPAIEITYPNRNIIFKGRRMMFPSVFICLSPLLFIE